MAETYTHTHTHTHTHGCLCKTIIPIIATFAIINPSYSDIAKNAQSATCDSSTIGTTTGPANLQAQWTANTINLDFYSNDTKVGTGTCSYDGAITLPSTPTVPTGYTFGGWKVRTANILARLNANTAPGNFYARGVWENQDVCLMGIDEISCQNNVFSDIAVSEWKAVFNYGTVYGIASCNNTYAEYSEGQVYFALHMNSVMQGKESLEDFMSGFSQVATSDEMSAVQTMLYKYQSGDESGAAEDMLAFLIVKNDNAQFSKEDTGVACWCQAKKLGATDASSTPWVTLDLLTGTDQDCARNCAKDCGNWLFSSSSVRAAMFGQ